MDFFKMLFHIITELPPEIIFILLALILIPALFATLLSFSFGKKKNKKTKESSEQKIEHSSGSIKEKEDDKIEEPKEEKSLSINKKEPFISKSSIPVENLKPVVINLDEILKEEIYRNVKIDEMHSLDILIINEYGIFLVFKEDSLKGKIFGKNGNEYLLRKKEKILNPIFIKDRYKDKLNNWLNVDRTKIEILCISKKIKKQDKELNIFNTESELFNYIHGINKKITIDEVFELTERLRFLDKR